MDGGEGVVLSMSSSSVAVGLALDVKASVVDGRDRWDWTRWREVGKWPVWKVDLWRRREPASDLGSVGACVSDGLGAGF